MSEMKRVLHLMWGTKQYRKAFGVPWVLFLICFLLALVFGGAPFINELVKEEVSIQTEFGLTILPAVFYLYISAYTGHQFNAIYKAGKSLLSFPIAKTALTKGIAVNRLIGFLVALIPSVVTRWLCVVLGYCEVSMLDDMILVYAVAFVLVQIMTCSAWIWVAFIWIYAAIAFICAFDLPIETVLLKRFSEACYQYEMPVLWVVISFTVLVVGGLVLGLKLMEITYRKRTAVYNTAQEKMAQTKGR